MASTGKKEYTLTINGVKSAITDVTTLEKALLALDKAVADNNRIGNAAVQASSRRKAALSDEEKAQQKLAATIKRAAEVRSDANKAQIQANIAVRETTREVMREVQARQLAEGSIKQVGMQLTDLRNTYESLSKVQREDAAVGGELLKQIQELDSQYKRLRESTGNFRDSVGNYEKALSGLGQLSEAVDGVSKSSMGLVQGLLGANTLMNLFGDQTEEEAKQAQQLQKVIGLLSLAQSINNNVLKANIIQTNLASVADNVRTIQLRAKTAAEALSTKGTIAATAAQYAFNVVASANPIVLITLALIAAGAALVGFTLKTEDAADKQKKLNELQKQYADSLDKEAERMQRVAGERVTQLERQLRLLEAREATQGEIRKAEDALASERRINNARLRGFYAQEAEDLDTNIKKLEQYRSILETIERARTSGGKKITFDVELDGNLSKFKVDEAANIVQSKIDEFDRKVKIGVELETATAEQEAADAALRAKRIKENREAAKAELVILRTAEDSKVKLIQDGGERAMLELSLLYERQIEDYKNLLNTEKELTSKSRKAINDTILNLQKQQVIDMEKLARDQVKQELATHRELEDSRIALIQGGYERQIAETNLLYDRQIDDYKAKLREDKSLTIKQQSDISEIILDAEEERGRALNALVAKQSEQLADRQLAEVEKALKDVETKIGEVVKRDKGGLQIIDVKATKDNLSAVNYALDEYVTGLSVYLSSVTEAHEQTLSTLKEGTQEYEDEMVKYVSTVDDVSLRIKGALKRQEDNVKASSKIQAEAWKDLFSKVSEYANAALTAVSSVMDTWSMGLQVQIEDLNTQLDTLTEHYEKAAEMREAATSQVEDLESRLRDATGGTAEVLKEQLLDLMHARSDAERQEASLLKEKEALEADIAKREKQVRRNDLTAQIAQSVANTALGVTQALSLLFPLNFVVAGLVGAMGAIQTGIITNQLTKLADGGEIVGPSHAGGGVPIPGTNYEAEGGEFVINKKSYAANKQLVHIINNSDRAIATPYSANAMPKNTTPESVASLDRLSEDRIIEAIENINFRPVVSVTDINSVNSNVVTVMELADF